MGSSKNHPYVLQQASIDIDNEKTNGGSKVRTSGTKRLRINLKQDEEDICISPGAKDPARKDRMTGERKIIKITKLWKKIHERNLTKKHTNTNNATEESYNINNIVQEEDINSVPVMRNNDSSEGDDVDIRQKPFEQIKRTVRELGGFPVISKVSHTKMRHAINRLNNDIESDELNYSDNFCSLENSQDYKKDTIDRAGEKCTLRMPEIIVSTDELDGVDTCENEISGSSVHSEMENCADNAMFSLDSLMESVRDGNSKYVDPQESSGIKNKNRMMEFENQIYKSDGSIKRHKSFCLDGNGKIENIQKHQQVEGCSTEEKYSNKCIKPSFGATHDDNSAINPEPRKLSQRLINKQSVKIRTEVSSKGPINTKIDKKMEKNHKKSESTVNKSANELFVEKVIQTLRPGANGGKSDGSDLLPTFAPLRGAKLHERKQLLPKTREIWGLEYRIKRCWVDVWEMGRLYPFYSQRQLSLKVSERQDVKLNTKVIGMMMQESQNKGEKAMAQILHEARFEFANKLHEVLVQKKSIYSKITPEQLIKWVSDIFNVKIERRDLSKYLQKPSYSLRLEKAPQKVGVTIEEAEHTFVDDALYEWYLLNLGQYRWSNEQFKLKASSLVKAGFPTKGVQYKVTDDWVRVFKDEYNIKSTNICAPGVFIETKKSTSTQVFDALNRYEPKNIYCVDEAGFHFRITPETVSSKKYDKRSAGRFGLILCTNGDGSDKVPIWVAGPHANMSNLDNLSELNIHYSPNSLSKVRAALFLEWLRWFDKRFAGRKVLLLLRNHPVHIKHLNLSLKHVELLYIPGGSPTQPPMALPLDLGILRTLRVLYRILQFKHLEMTFNSFDHISSDFTVALALKFLSEAWNSLFPTALISCCFRDMYISVGSSYPTQINTNYVHSLEISLFKQLNYQIRGVMGFDKPFSFWNLLSPPRDLESICSCDDSVLINMAEDDSLAIEEELSRITSLAGSGPFIPFFNNPNICIVNKHPKFEESDYFISSFETPTVENPTGNKSIVPSLTSMLNVTTFPSVFHVDSASNEDTEPCIRSTSSPLGVSNTTNNSSPTSLNKISRHEHKNESEYQNSNEDEAHPGGSRLLPANSSFATFTNHPNSQAALHSNISTPDSASTLVDPVSEKNSSDSFSGVFYSSSVFSL
ncbi:Tigger transposable element-derived protein 6 [Zancudomyces culisetae]|uniref:Tigger transposable element-derived protein 6 n=1 Tax=Zancudomyces culisetae TaxID=1213189 RepID=A0A1R1PME8_ZANCU|nr:Tigger transposable element-derived protein 6 [Zancudomyces culisetae]|eukprot:OMH82113.1 Tigger transposable element-derived protein 6 [Zancudomyces culisetae]